MPSGARPAALITPTMNRLILATALLPGWCLSDSIAAPQYLAVGENAVGHWNLERVVLRDRRELRGYIESEDPCWLNLVQIERPANRPMYLVIRPIKRNLVVEMDRLASDKRDALRRRIEAFRNHTLIEAAQADAIKLALFLQDNQHFHRYRGRWFTLETDVDEPTTRRMIVRLEQVFTAYRQVLPPRLKPSRPLRLKVFGSMTAYREFLSRSAIRAPGSACFVVEDNLVVGGSRMNQLAAALKKTTARDASLRARLEELEVELRERLREASERLRSQGVAPALIRKLAIHETANLHRQVDRIENGLKECARDNARTLEELRAEVFSRLAHEAFHAYLENYVYPHDQYDVPRWLNEGLAVMFEQGQLESDTLRVDAPNRAALKRLQEDLCSPDRLRLEELLASGADEFLEADSSNRYYAHSWGAAYYLTFRCGLLSGPALDRYVRSDVANQPPVVRFEKFFGRPLDEFERQWHEYVSALDGSSR